MTPNIIPRPSEAEYPLNGSYRRRDRTTRVFLHCTATGEGREVTFGDLYRWHVRDNGWTDAGYHYLIMLNETNPGFADIQVCRPAGVTGAGVSGHNHDSIHICYAGGVDAGDPTIAKDTRTEGQKASMLWLLRDLMEDPDWPDLDHHTDIVGHNEVAAKACPSFDVDDWIEEVLREGETGNPEPGDPSMPVFELVSLVREHGKRIDALEAINAELMAALEKHGRAG